MPPSLEISPARADDVAALLPLFRAYQKHYDQLTKAGEVQTRRFLADLVENAGAGFVLLAREGAQLAGFAAVYFTVSGLIAERIAHLGDLYVVPERRHAGIGTALFEAVSDAARGRGIRLVRWLSLASNTELNRWYAGLVPPAGTFELFLRPTGAP